MLKNSKIKKKIKKPESSIFRLGFPQDLYEKLQKEAEKNNKSFSAYVSEILEIGFFHKLTNEAAGKLTEKRSKKYAPVVLPKTFHAQISAIADTMDMSIAELCRDILIKRDEIDFKNPQIKNLAENFKAIKLNSADKEEEENGKKTA